MQREKHRWKKKEIEKLKQLIIQGKPFSTISKEIGRTFYSVTSKSKRLGIKHPYLSSSFKPIISPELAYILGAWLGDGTSRKKLGIFVKDKDFALKFHNYLEKILNRNINIKKYGNRYFVQRIDKDFAIWINNKDINEISEFIESGGILAISNFLNGFFDAEGTVIKRYTQVTQNNKKTLEVCKELLIKLNTSSYLFRYKGKYKNKPYISYVLRIEKLSSLINFYNKVGFSIQKKQKKLKQVIKTKLKNHPISLKKYNQFLEIYKTGLSIPLIAKELNLSFHTIYQWNNKTSLPILVKNNIKLSDLKEFGVQYENI